MNSYTHKLANPTADYQDAIRMLYTIKDELRLPDQVACQKVADLCFEKGGVLLVYDGSQACGLGGFFYGDPNENYADKSVGFIYVAAILPEYRMTRVFYEGLRHTLHTVKEGGSTHIRLQAEKSNPYTNKLYSRFARPVREGRSLRGVPVMTYQNEVDKALAYFERRRVSMRPKSSAVNHA